MSGVVRLTAAELDEDVMKELAQRMQENAWELTSAKGNQLNGTINAQEDKTLFFSIPYDKGFTIKVDNKVISYEKVDKAFVGFPITKGEHDISIVYTAPGLKYGLIFSITGFIIYGMVIIMEHKKGKKL